MNCAKMNCGKANIKVGESHKKKLKKMGKKMITDPGKSTTSFHLVPVVFFVILTKNERYIRNYPKFLDMCP